MWSGSARAAARELDLRVLGAGAASVVPDELFDDLFEVSGRRSVPPSVVATVMVLQRLGGLSDREAVERYAFDVRWRYAAGVGGYGAGWECRGEQPPDQEHDGCPSHHGRPVQLISGRDY
jgi:hypothetical protein